MTPQPSTQGTAFWLRAWQIKIVTPSGTYTITNSQYESLRVLFSIDMGVYPLTAYWQASVSIYNLSPSIINKILQTSSSLANPVLASQPIAMGDSVSISGGYQYGSSGAWNASSQLLYTGRVFQSILTRENVVDYKLTLRCITERRT